MVRKGFKGLIRSACI